MTTKKQFVFLLLCLILFSFRFFFLDQDAPSYFIGGINQGDETYYSFSAVVKYDIDKGKTLKGFEKPPFEGMGMYSTPLTYISLHILGNNYYGLRIPIVLLSIITILLLRKTLLNLNVDSKIVWMTTLYLCVDFYFLLFSRFQTPQIYSIFVISLAIFLLFQPKNTNYYALGFFTFFSISFVYIYNLYFFAACSIWALLISIKTKDWKPLLKYSFGVFSSLALFWIILELIQSPLSEIVKQMVAHGGGVKGEDDIGLQFDVARLLKLVISSPIQIISTNFFRFNLGMLFLFLLAFSLVIFKFKKSKESFSINLFFLLIFVFSFFQNIFVLSYPFKKLITLLPPIILFTVYNLSFLKREDLLNRKIVIVSVIVSLLIVLYNFKLNNSQSYWSGFRYGYYLNTPLAFNILNILCCCLIIFILLFSLYKDRKVSIPLITLCLLASPLFLDIYYLGVKKTFGYKNLMLSMATHYSDKIFVSNTVHPFQYYSGIIPVLNPYMKNGPYAEAIIRAEDSLYATLPEAYKLDLYYKNDTSIISRINVGDTLRLPDKKYELQLVEKNELPFYHVNIYKNIIKSN